MLSRCPYRLRALAWTPPCSHFDSQLFLLHNSSRASATTLATPSNQDAAFYGDARSNFMREVSTRLSSSERIPAVSILEALRRHYPRCTVTQTLKSTGLLKLAKAGRATATFDTANLDFYASRKYKQIEDALPGLGRLKYSVDIGKYDYYWNNEYFHVYAADYWENDCSRIDHQWIVYPRKEGDVINGQSQIVDKLIVEASKQIDQLNDEIWVYDRGYWRKNHKLWQSVQACSWEDVILDPEMKSQLISDIEGFFDRKEDYQSFAVPWKVSSLT